ncbi:efflux RND transporter periplasmic adaptor subunit [Sulfuricurvum sp.]|uniref:efflux RND transporter periplasmic adaptor subunit n=1 Tax=Sulfuricurvum sp. TaxID=2025608 RepID=UPI002611ACB5|nr:efflux RND transporter periplasmic adaptor subunit [Sulfuricurvum sp.]MDD2837934.1 efflux RND transporter periplasmic adaptor subunit [Sulfuricurvum sp.]MDD3596272.1 efflux RND transporter periplasmic adaptor subunit [Sulfuricurvum sp.]
MKEITKFFLLLMLLMLSATIVHGKEELLQNPTASGSVVKVDVYEVKKPHAEVFNFNYPARLNAYQVSTVVSRVTGILEKKYFKEGDFVRKGSLLYKIESNNYLAKMDEIFAEVELKKATVSNSKKEWERVENLYKNSAISKKEYDTVFTAYEVAKADLRSSNARLQSARIDFEYTRVKAPISGIIGIKLIDIGNVVNQGTQLVSITQIDPIHAEFSIPDTDLFKSGSNLRKIAKLSKLKVIFTYEGKNYSGFIDYIAPQINMNNGSVKIRALLDNPDHSILPGAFGRISIIGIQSAPIIKIPEKAILQNKNSNSVMIVVNGKISIHNIRLGKRVGSYFIVEEGLKEGDKVVINNFFRITSGTSVVIDKIVQ